MIYYKIPSSIYFYRYFVIQSRSQAAYAIGFYLIGVSSLTLKLNGNSGTCPIASPKTNPSSNSSRSCKYLYCLSAYIIPNFTLEKRWYLKYNYYYDSDGSSNPLSSNHWYHPSSNCSGLASISGPYLICYMPFFSYSSGSAQT